MTSYEWVILGMLVVALVVAYNLLALLWEWWHDRKMFRRVEDHASRQWLEKRRKKESKDG